MAFGTRWTSSLWLCTCTASALLAVSAAGFAQERVSGSIPVTEADVTGALMVSSGRNVLGGASIVKARDHVAHVDLSRGGLVKVCQTSSVHFALGRHVQDPAPIMIALDRGAMEIQTELGLTDSILTPDLRFISLDARDHQRPLDLAIRVTPNGDTCVDNRGKKAPTLIIADAFGEKTYQLKAGQHVLFEHGSLKEVVDRETSDCGCPPDAPAGVSIADASGNQVRPDAGDPHPFPTAISQGLAQPATPSPEAPGETHVQLATTITLDPSTPPAGSAATPTNGAARPSTTKVKAAKTKTARIESVQGTTKKSGPMHAIGRFFKHIFVR